MSVTVKKYNKQQIWHWLEEVNDPEIPVLNIVEMGIARSVDVEGNRVVVKITPTYSGCPAMKSIEMEIRVKLLEKGVDRIEIEKDYSHPWTTDWMTDRAKEKLKNYGIAPPEKSTEQDDTLPFRNAKVVPCPYCDSLNTRLQSEFGSTPCKSQYYCNDCEEPFEHFKCV